MTDRPMYFFPTTFYIEISSVTIFERILKDIDLHDEIDN